MGHRVAHRCLSALASGAVLSVLAVLVLLPAPAAGPVQPLAAPAAEPPAAAGAPPSCARVLAGMTPRAKLAQRLVVGVDAGDVAGTVETVRETQVGGIFLGGNDTALLTDQALRKVQAVARIPVSVAVDDEGGRVQRIEMLDGQLPSARSMAKRPVAEVRALAEERGRKLAARGVTVDYAPVADVSDQPANAVIGDRSFSNDPDVVTTYAGAFAEGLRAAGITPVFKHFPGHGHSSGDSHRGRVSTPPLDQLRAGDLRPYETLPQPGDQVMVGHLDVPGLTGDLPTSLTPEAYRLLREDNRFDGVVVTDDLGAMKAITSRFTVAQAVTRALAAGADQALWSAGGDVAPVLTALERALADGTLEPAANDTAVARVLEMKGLCTR